MPRDAPTEPEIPDDEEDIDLDEDEELDLGGEVDLLDALSSMLTTEEGETLATALVSLKDATERIATGLEMQNKILVKILTAMKPAGAAPSPEVQA